MTSPPLPSCCPLPYARYLDLYSKFQTACLSRGWTIATDCSKHTTPQPTVNQVDPTPPSLTYTRTRMCRICEGEHVGNRGSWPPRILIQGTSGNKSSRKFASSILHNSPTVRYYAQLAHIECSVSVLVVQCHCGVYLAQHKDAAFRIGCIPVCNGTHTERRMGRGAQGRGIEGLS
jgi:hypothetical protein